MSFIFRIESLLTKEGPLVAGYYSSKYPEIQKLISSCAALSAIPRFTNRCDIKGEFVRFGMSLSELTSIDQTLIDLIRKEDPSFGISLYKTKTMGINDASILVKDSDSKQFAFNLNLSVRLLHFKTIKEMLSAFSNKNNSIMVY